MLVATGLLGGVLAVGYLMGRNGTGRPTSVTSAAGESGGSSSRSYFFCVKSLRWDHPMTVGDRPAQQSALFADKEH